MLEIMKEAANVASNILLSYFPKDLEIIQKTSHQSIVTVADIEAQTAIQATISTLLHKKGFNESEIGFVGEENLHAKGKHTFIIDPLDGTSNFASGLDTFAISIAYFDEDKLISSVIYQPVSGIMHYAELGKGSYKVTSKDKTKLVIKPKNLKNSLLATYITSNKPVREKLIKAVFSLHPHYRSLRILGAATIDGVYLTENVLGTIIYGRTNIWDIAGIKLIIEEAGGKIYDWKGHEVELDIAEPAKQYEVYICHPDHSTTITSVLDQI